MILPFDFGFEGQGVSFNRATIVLLFDSDSTLENVPGSRGPAAIADASRFIELFEMQIGISPYAAGIYSEIVSPDDAEGIVNRAGAVTESGKTPIIISRNRKTTGLFCKAGLVAFWGKLGRNECNEAKLFSQSGTILAGIRSANNAAFKSVTGDVVLLTAGNLMREPDKLQEALTQISGPLHLSIDLDVLAPGEVLNDRCLEPGGLNWYTLVNLISALFDSIEVSSVDVTGCSEITSRSPASHLGAQLVLKLAGLLAAKKAASTAALK